jgi:acyl-CoA thioester hydrolase
MTAVTAYKGLVGPQQADASGNLDARFAAAVLVDSFHIFSALSDPVDASVDGAQNVAEPFAVLSLRRKCTPAPRVGELLRCVLQPVAAGAAENVFEVALEGEHGTAWTGVVRAGTGGMAVRALRAPQADLPAAVLTRRMHSEHCDQAGHVNVQVFLGLVDEAVAVLSRELAPERARLHVVEARVAFKSELFCGDVVSVHSGITAFDAKSMEMVHGIYHQPSGRLACLVQCKLAALDAEGRPVDHAWDARRVEAGSIQAWPALPRARPLAAPRAGAQPGTGSELTCMAVVDAWDADDAGWLQTRALVNMCSTGARQYLAQIGLDRTRFARDQSTVAAIDYAIDLHRRPALGCNLSMRSSLLTASGKVIRFAHHLVDSQSGEVYATIEIVGVMLDLVTHRSTDIPADIRARLEQMASSC